MYNQHVGKELTVAEWLANIHCFIENYVSGNEVWAKKLNAKN